MIFNFSLIRALGFTRFLANGSFWCSGAAWAIRRGADRTLQPNLQETVSFIKLTLIWMHI